MLKACSQYGLQAKLLQPAIDVDVTLYEDVARTSCQRSTVKIFNAVPRGVSGEATLIKWCRNPISAMPQSTRWMLGEAWFWRLEADTASIKHKTGPGAQLQLPCQRNLHTHGEGLNAKEDFL